MAFWRHPLRLGLALVVVGVSVSVFLNLRERAEPVQAVVVQRTDPDAIIQTRGSEVVQADAFGDNIRVVAAQQMTYEGGGLRMTDGVEVTVEARDDRDGFVLSSQTATVDAGKTELSLSGDVRLVAGGDLEASTESAQFTESEGVVRMPGAATFVRGDMEASAARSVYERSADRLQLHSRAAVTLSGAGETPTTIGSDSATVAQADGYMAFEGGVSIEAGGLLMEAARAHLLNLLPTARADKGSPCWVTVWQIAGSGRGGATAHHGGGRHRAGVRRRRRGGGAGHPDRRRPVGADGQHPRSRLGDRRRVDGDRVCRGWRRHCQADCPRRRGVGVACGGIVSGAANRGGCARRGRAVGRRAGGGPFHRRRRVPRAECRGRRATRRARRGA